MKIQMQLRKDFGLSVAVQSCKVIKNFSGTLKNSVCTYASS